MGRRLMKAGEMFLRRALLTMSFSAGNQEMNAAMTEGKRTLSRFLDDLKRPPPGSSRFALKVAFREGQKVEYMWVDEPRPEGELFVGRLINDPRTFEGPRRGDQLKVKRADVVDWSYVRDGRLVGGYTLRVMFRTVPVEEREAFQQRLEYRFDRRARQSGRRTTLSRPAASDLPWRPERVKASSSYRWFGRTPVKRKRPRLSVTVASRPPPRPRVPRE